MKTPKFRTFKHREKFFHILCETCGTIIPIMQKGDKQEYFRAHIAWHQELFKRPILPITAHEAIIATIEGAHETMRQSMNQQRRDLGMPPILKPDKDNQ